MSGCRRRASPSPPTHRPTRTGRAAPCRRPSLPANRAGGRCVGTSRSEVSLRNLEHGEAERPPHAYHLLPVVENPSDPPPVADLPIEDLALHDRVLAAVAGRAHEQRL